MTTITISDHHGRRTLTGRTVESIIRREYGRTTEIRWSRDRQATEVGHIVQWSNRADAYRVLGRLISWDGTCEAARQGEDIPAAVDADMQDDIAADAEAAARQAAADEPAQLARALHIGRLIQLAEDDHHRVVDAEQDLTSLRNARTRSVRAALRAGATQDDVARQLGVTRQAVSRWVS